MSGVNVVSEAISLNEMCFALPKHQHMHSKNAQLSQRVVCLKLATSSDLSQLRQQFPRHKVLHA